MKKRLSAFLGAALIFLSGCTTQIDYSQVTLAKEPEVTAETDDSKEVGQETMILPSLSGSDSYKPSSPVVSALKFSEVYQPEFNTEAQSYTTGLSDFNGTGFICIGSKEYATITVDLPSSQHYKIGLRVCTTGAKIAVIDGAEEVIDLNSEHKTLSGTVHGAIYTGECQEFTYLWLDGVYLGKGECALTFQSLSGTVYIDEISIENTSSVPKLAYEVSNSCVAPNVSDSVKTVKRYLADVYGNKVLTGQFCSSGTNTEINAVYMSTGRYSAVRCADIGIFTEYYSGSDKNNSDEIDTAVSWWKQGGLVSYSWYWEAPCENTSCFYELADFSINSAYTETDISNLSPTALETYEQTGRISSDGLKLIHDIDAVATQLKLLDAQGVPVLFRPLPEAGNGWYWWGVDSEKYNWLYKLIFRRFTEYHALTNIIWIWDGESADFYPGDEYVDIVGMDIYTDSDISGNIRMKDAISYTIKTKAAALTECGRIPDPDRIVRDNAYWLWFALWKGDYIINKDGSISYEHVDRKDLDYAYNNELYITLDELPDFSRY